MHANWKRFGCVGTGIVALGTLVGCVSESVIPKAGDGKSLPSQARKIRGSSAEREGTGLSSEARDIEKDLGYR
jgi:hypothetical protein